jgi:hypothetical protein
MRHAIRHINPVYCVCFVLLITPMLLSACSPGGPGGSSTSSVSADVKATQGATLTHPNGATLTIPPGALSGDAHVTLTDAGKTSDIQGNPLNNLSDDFSVDAKGAGGGAVQLKGASLSIKPPNFDKNATRDLIVAVSDPATPQVVQLHRSKGTPTDGAGVQLPSLSYDYGALGSRVWIVRIPALPAGLRASTAEPRLPAPSAKPQPGSSGAVLAVPFYHQNGLPWCVPTSLTAMLRYYDFTPTTGDPLNATFGGDTALANWQVAAQSHQPAGSGAGYDELDRIGVDGSHYAMYLWDDDFLITADGARGNFDDFRTYVTFVIHGFSIPGIIDIPGRPLAMIVDNWWHSVAVVGADSEAIYFHDSNGNIAYHDPWATFQNDARGWRTDATGQRIETHTIWTAAVYGYAIKPEAKRQGSVVLLRSEISDQEPLGTTDGFQWDGAHHTHGYYFTNDTDYSPSDLGIAAIHGTRLHFTYHIANVTGVTQTYNTLAELSGPNYGDGLVSRAATVTVAPLTLSDPISGDLTLPGSGAGGIFDVKLFEPGSTSAVADVKFVRMDLRDTQSPTVAITSPANGAHVTAGSAVAFSATSLQPDAHSPLHDEQLVWTQGGSRIGTGASFSRVYGTPGTYTITLTGTNAAGLSASASTTFTVDPATPGYPASVSIVSPPANHDYYIPNGQSTVAVSLVASGSPGMSFTWSDNVEGSLGAGANVTANLHDTSSSSTCSTRHDITLHGVDSFGRTANATVSVYVHACIP